MRLRSWTVHVGPLILAAALVPTVLGALLLAAPARPSGHGGAGGRADAWPAVPGPTAPAKAEMAPAAAPPLPCTPLRGRRPQAPQAQAARVDAVLSPDGEQIGRRLELRAGRGAEISVSLPADSFVAQPSGDWLVYGAAGRHDSEVRAIDLETGCDVRLARVDGVARGAILDPAGTALYVHAVEERSRRDLGVTRVELASGETTQALPRFKAPDGFGPVFATSLSWSMDGTSLAVQSCGAEACHTRLLDTLAGEAAAYDTPHGGLVGVSATHLFCFDASHERPAALLAIARADGKVSVLVNEAYAARLGGTAFAPLLNVDTPAGWQEVAP